MRRKWQFGHFALAGGLIKGEHKDDFPFDDVNKVLEGTPPQSETSEIKLRRQSGVESEVSVFADFVV